LAYIWSSTMGKQTKKKNINNFKFDENS
jgi:hypothetical protein